MNKLAKKIVTLAVLAAPVFSFAAYSNPSINPPSVNVRNISDINRIISNIVNWLMGIFFVLAVVMIFYAAFLFLTSGGDEEKTKKGKQTLTYAIIAIAVALLASGVRYLVESLLNS